MHKAIYTKVCAGFISDTQKKLDYNIFVHFLVVMAPCSFSLGLYFLEHNTNHHDPLLWFVGVLVAQTGRS